MQDRLARLNTWAGHPRARLAAWVVVVAVFAGGMWRVETTAHKAETAVAGLAVEQELSEARACITVWEGRLGVRALIAGLVASASTADPARVRAFEEDMARRLPDPDCDLAAAVRVVDEAESRPGLVGRGPSP